MSAKINHNFLAKMKGHNLIAGITFKAIMMFDLYSKICLERIKNHLFPICEQSRDYCYEKHIVRG